MFHMQLSPQPSLGPRRRIQGVAGENSRFSLSPSALGGKRLFGDDQSRTGTAQGLGSVLRTFSPNTETKRTCSADGGEGKNFALPLQKPKWPDEPAGSWEAAPQGYGAGAG